MNVHPDVEALAAHGIDLHVQTLIAGMVDRAYRRGGHDALAALHGVCDRIAKVPVATALVESALAGWDRIEPFTDLEALS